jgi:hypothetical protein
MTENKVAENVSVKITRVTCHLDPPSTNLEFVVRNEGSVPVWLVNDRWLIWQQKGQRIYLSFHRGKMRAGAQVFGYFNPEVTIIRPGHSITQTVNLNWPQPLDSLWNNKSQAAPSPGLYQISVRVGYGMSYKPGPPELNESIDAGVFRWQKVAVSTPVPMEVPPYTV